MMSGTAKGRFPARSRPKIEREKTKNFNHQVLGLGLKDDSVTLVKQVRMNLNSFYEIYGESEEEEEFLGFSLEECNPNGYKELSSGAHSLSEIYGSSHSPIVVEEKMVTTRLALTRNSVDVPPPLRRNSTEVHKMNSSVEAALDSDDYESFKSTGSSCAPENSNINIHRLHENANCGGMGRPKSHEDAFLARAIAQCQVSKSHELEHLTHSSTPVTPRSTKPKVRSFVLPARSSRSSRIIKANPKYVDEDVRLEKNSKDVASPPSTVQRLFPRRKVSSTEVYGSVDQNLKDKSLKSRRHSHVKQLRQWQISLSKDPADSKSIYLGLDKRAFYVLCMPTASTSKKGAWTVREIHNILHGVHILGINQWHWIRKLYMFELTHSVQGIRERYEAAARENLVSGAKVKMDILLLLQPKLSVEGVKYFQVSTDKCALAIRGRKTVQPAEVCTSKSKSRTRGRKRHLSGTDRMQPPRKRPTHTIKTAPVLNASDRQSLDSNSELVGDTTNNNILPTLNKAERQRRTQSEFLGLKRRTRNARGTSRYTKSKRLGTKTTYQRSFAASGRKVAAGAGHVVSNQEQKKIDAKVEKLGGAQSNSNSATNSTGEMTGDIPRLKRRKENNSKISKKKRELRNEEKCNTRKNCAYQKCGACKLCRSKSHANSCLRRPQYLHPTYSSDGSPKETGKKSSGRPKREMTLAPVQTERKSNSPLQSLPNHAVAAGVVLSPDSRRRLQQELHERDRQLPSVVQIDEWKERYELEDLWQMGGVSVIASVTPSTRFVCFLCGSAGKERPMRQISSNSDASVDAPENFVRTPLFVFCFTCCEPFHPFCLEDHEQQLAISDAKKGIWICKRCRFCNVCGRPGNLLECNRCTKTYHSSCLGPNYPTKPSKNRVWICMRCVRCRSCGASRPGLRAGSKWTHDFQLCQKCGDLFNKGNFCPICRRCYRDEDYETRMVQCGTCNRWVHSRCENMTIEMYTMLSHLPDDVQYVCPDCDGRRAQAELHLSHGETTLTEDDGNDSIEGEKMKKLLSKLPPPSWMVILENELQSGIETVVMELFHNKEAACIMKRSVAREESGHPVDLFAVRYAVHNRRYASVAQFSSDVCYILDTIFDEDNFASQDVEQSTKKKKRNAGARGAFCQEMHEVFPWFDVDTGRVIDCSDVPEDLLPHATLPPHDDHIYAQWQDRDIDVSAVGPDTPLKNFLNSTPSKADNIGTIVWSLSPRKEFDDMRQCLFCCKYGDDIPTNAGRLVYCGQDEWVHVNCALWSAEVFERHDGSLQNVYSAVSRGRMMKCKLCMLPGATVGCNSRDCPKNYHFACARLAQCSFQDDKKVFCARHEKSVDGELVAEEGFEVGRRAVVDNDEMRPNRRWQRGMQSRDITVLLGSAIVHQLGQISPCSDDKDYLVPVNFRMTRMFWSATHAGRRVRYTITVTEQKSLLNGPALVKDPDSDKGLKMEHHENLTISHASEDDNLVKTPSKSLRYPGAESCRSKLIDRIQSLSPGPLMCRKSHDEAAEKSSSTKASESSSYTVIGSCNRTLPLPQAITPLPTVSRCSNSLQRLIPDGSRSQNDATNPLKDVSKNLVPTESSAGSSKSSYLSQVVKKVELTSGDAVVVSPQNPFLNLKIGDTSTDSDSPKPCLSPVLENRFFKALPASAKGISNKSVFKDLFAEQAGQRKAHVVQTTDVSHETTRFRSGSSGSLTRKASTAIPINDAGPLNSVFALSQSKCPAVPDQPKCEKTVQTTVSSAKSTPAIAGQLKCDRTFPSSVSSAKTSPTFSGEQFVTKVSSANSAEKLVPTSSECTTEMNSKTNSFLNKILDKQIPIVKSGMASVVLEDIFVKTDKGNLNMSNKGQDSSEPPNKSQSPASSEPELLMKLHKTTGCLDTKFSIPKNIMIGAPPEHSSTAISLLQQARNAGEEESFVEPRQDNIPVESANLWWKQTGLVKKKAGDVKREWKRSRATNRSIKRAKAKEDSGDEFVVSDDYEEETEVRKMPTRSRLRRTATRLSPHNEQNTEIRSNRECATSKDSIRRDQSRQTSEHSKLAKASVAAARRTVLENFDALEKETQNRAQSSKDEICKKCGTLCHDVSSLENSTARACLSKVSLLDDSAFKGMANATRKKSVLRMRKFAKESKKSTRCGNRRNVNKETRHLVESRLPVRRFSHDSAPFEEEGERKSTRSSHDMRVKTRSEDLSLVARFPSRSRESKTGDKSVEHAQTDLLVSQDEVENRRYPRRNPFICLKSFSGLSPNYAIWSYSLTEQTGGFRSHKKKKSRRLSKEIMAINSYEIADEHGDNRAEISPCSKIVENLETKLGDRACHNSLKISPTVLADTLLCNGQDSITEDAIVAAPKSVSSATLLVNDDCKDTNAVRTRKRRTLQGSKVSSDVSATATRSRRAASYLQKLHDDVTNADKAPELFCKATHETFTVHSQLGNEFPKSCSMVGSSAHRSDGVAFKADDSKETQNQCVGHEPEESIARDRSSETASQQAKGRTPVNSQSVDCSEAGSALDVGNVANKTNQIRADLSDASPPPIEVQRGIVRDNKSNEKQIDMEPDIVHESDKSGQQRPGLVDATPRSPIPTSSLTPLESVLPSVDRSPVFCGMGSLVSQCNGPKRTLQNLSPSKACPVPVLNDCEVQSLLAMPPITTPSALTFSTPILTPTFPKVLSCQAHPHVTPVAQKNIIPLCNNPPTATYTYNASCAEKPVRLLNHTVAMPRNTMPGATCSRMQPKYRMVIPTVNPSALQQPIYVANMNQHSSFDAVLSPTVTCKMQPAVRLAHSAQERSESFPMSMQSVATASSEAALHRPVTVASPLSTICSLANMKCPMPRLDDEVQLSQDQAKKLEKMIKFFCEKNNLSTGEKQLVRQIIVEQIKNKSLPLPALDDNKPAAHPEKPGNRPNILAGQKHKQSTIEPSQPLAKKSKKQKRKETHEVKSIDPDTPAAAACEPCCQISYGDAARSPLLDVYMNAMHAERTTDKKLVKRWREVISGLSKMNVYLDGPWHPGKGQKENENRLPPPPQSSKQCHLLYEIKSDDGYHAKGTDLQELVSGLLNAVQECRANSGLLQANSLCLSAVLSPHAFLGLSHDAVRFLVEQLPSARHCVRYRAKYHKHKESPVEVVTHINPHGCARAEKYQGRSKPDMFSFLVSKHRLPPSHDPSQTQNIDMQQNSTRRPTSMDLPMAMRFRHLKTSAREAVGVYRSAIHGRGLYCKRDIEAGEMVMEYTGEVIRSFMTDSREKMYESKGIGCYMFRMDDMYVIDATVMGSGARFINHSCEPSCYSRIVTVDGKKHIIIFASRKILRGEELTYDYKFPIEDEDQKIMCNCGAKTCRKFMN